MLYHYGRFVTLNQVSDSVTDIEDSDDDASNVEDSDLEEGAGEAQLHRPTGIWVSIHGCLQYFLCPEDICLMAKPRQPASNINWFITELQDSTNRT